MVAGMSVFNTQNSLQIDDRFDTYSLASKFVTRDITASNLPVGINVFSPTTLGGEIQTAAPKTQLNDVTVYTFTKNVNINDNFGLQVFKADGSTAFHSSGKPLRVVDFVRRKTHKPDGSRDYDPLTKYYSGYSRLGVVIPSTIAIVTLTGNINAGTALLFPSARINTDSIVFGYRPRYIPPEIYENPQGFNDFIVVDLTNY